MARFTVYLPDPIRERGRALGLNMSGLLRCELIQAFHELEGDHEAAARVAAAARAMRLSAPAALYGARTEVASAPRPGG